ncbi:ATP-dependent RNA helicase DHX30-like [Vanessa atalanta]|uniref:ATP-dependent RNA helicase DHX30-like n=1 Tax=Vanessa atalanta TaxID=42275 RepID=UPI001FCE23E6|nr:ATP-dependent RNA helicase DHX30-like [Vanessa atalanta]
MFLRKFARCNAYRLLVSEHSCYKLQHFKSLCGTNNKLLNEYFSNLNRNAELPASYSVRHYSKKLIEDIFKDSNKEIELSKINEIFKQPRVTLNELLSKTPQKIFDIHYKQPVVAPKGGKKKNIQSDWTCTYSFIWPEKMKFESTAISKRKAAEKAATQAVHWLYKNKRIDDRGCPIYDKTVIKEIQSTLNKDLHITISDNSIERINKIWNDYETEIKSIYEATFNEAQRKLLNMASVFKKDSTIDDQDCSEEIMENEDDKFDSLTDLKPPIHPVFGKQIEYIQSAMERRERTLKQTFINYDEKLTQLPIDAYAEEISSTIEKSRVTVIVGAAGCGKSTRAPAAILRHCGVDTAAIVSEPRRVAAIGLAQRVADELGEQVGESIGYQVRLHSKLPRPPGGAILYCTSGVLLRRLQLNPGLEGCSHVFIDEAHERDVNTDVTLLLLKRALKINPKLKIIVMSATLDTAVFTNYFNDCPIIEVPGKTYPVEISNLEDIQKKFNLNLSWTQENCTKPDGKPQIDCVEIVDVINAVDKTQSEGAILVFLPGWAEIKQTKQLLDNLYRNSPLHMVLPVHSRLSTSDQTKMFAKPSPGVRKIVLATNIAETSITIPDVVHVIDSGAHKENRIKEGTGAASLEAVWVSRAGAAQRAGRAGRVRAGHCYRMYTKDKEEELIPHTTPEILRIPLEQTVLDCKSYAQDDKVENFLSQLPEPPSKQAIQFAVNDLIELGALTESEQMTRLGVLLSSMTVHPRLGRCVLNGAIVGGVVPAANIATHCSDNVDLFRNSPERREEIRNIKRTFSQTSDHAAVHWIQDEFEQMSEEKDWEAVDRWCEKYGLRKDRLNYVKSISNLHLEHLFKTGIVERTMEVSELNRFSDIDELTSAILLSGSNSLLVTRKHVKTKGKLMTGVGVFTSKGERAHIGSESVNYGIKKSKLNTQLLTYFGGYHSIERRALVVYRTSLISPHAVLLFSTGDIKQEILEGSDGETTELYHTKHKLAVQMPTGQAELILKAREMLRTTLQYYIERDVRNIEFDDITLTSRFKTRLVKTLGRILVEADKEHVQTSDDIR